MTGHPSPRWRVVALTPAGLDSMTTLQLQSAWAGSNVCMQPRLLDGLAIAAPCQATAALQRFRVHCEPTYCNSIGNLCLECQSAGVCARCVDNYFVNVFGVCGGWLSLVVIVMGCAHPNWPTQSVALWGANFAAGPAA